MAQDRGADRCDSPRPAVPGRGPALTRTRLMTEADLDRVLELEAAIFPQPWSRAHFEPVISSVNGCCLVAETDREFAGYAVAWSEGDEFHLANIAVRPGLGRQGIGSALMAEVFRQARERGMLTLYLEVRETNTGAIAFYRQHGFMVTGFRRGYYPGGETAVIMERDA